MSPAVSKCPKSNGSFDAIATKSSQSFDSRPASPVYWRTIRGDSGVTIQMPTKFSHQGICVKDLETSARFYEDVLQFSPAEDYGYMGGEWLEQGTDIKGIDIRPYMLR